MEDLVRQHAAHFPRYHGRGHLVMGHALQVQNLSVQACQVGERQVVRLAELLLVRVDDEKERLEADAAPAQQNYRQVKEVDARVDIDRDDDVFATDRSLDGAELG